MNKNNSFSQRPFLGAGTTLPDFLRCAAETTTRRLNQTSIPFFLGIIFPSLLVLCFLSMPSWVNAAEMGKIPFIYSSDIYHPPADPDDHYDLALLFALHELEVKAFLFDNAMHRDNPGDHAFGALKQVAAIYNKPVPPFAVGLSQPLKSLDDPGTDQPAEFQKGVELLLDTLRKSEQKVVLFLVGSCRDFAAAFNREPELLKNKVKAVYVNAGNGPDGEQNEWNVMLCPVSYESLMMSGLPIYWCPCFHGLTGNMKPGELEIRKQYATHFVIPNQAEFLRNVSPELHNFFFYMLNNCPEDPIAFLKSEPQPLPTSGRHMWCSGPFFHAAGRDIYRSTDGKYMACTPEQARALGSSVKKIEVYRFEPLRLERGYKDDSTLAKENTVCRFMGTEEDKVGQNSLEKDGIKDHHVRISGLDVQKKIAKIVITAPREARWESTPSDRWWRVASERNGEYLDCYFSPYTPGTHTLSLSFEDGSNQEFTCYVPGRWPYFRSTFVENSSTEVFRYLEKDFNAIMCSVVSGLLEQETQK